MTPEKIREARRQRMMAKYKGTEEATWKSLSPAERFKQALKLDPEFRSLDGTGTRMGANDENLDKLLKRFMKGVRNTTRADKRKYAKLETQLRRAIFKSDTTHWSFWAANETKKGKNVWVADGDIGAENTRIEPRRAARQEAREAEILRRGEERITLARGDNKRVIMVRSEDYIEYPNLNTNINVQLEEEITCIPRVQQITAKVTSASFPNSFYQVSNNFRNRYFDVLYNGTNTLGVPFQEIVRFDLGPGTYTCELNGNTLVSTLIDRLEFLFNDWLTTPNFVPGAGISTNWTIGPIQPHNQAYTVPPAGTPFPIQITYEQPRNRLVFNMRNLGVGPNPNLPDGYIIMLMDNNSPLTPPVGLPPTDLHFPRLVGLDPVDGDGPNVFASNSFASNTWVSGPFTGPYTLFGPFSLNMYHARELLIHLGWGNTNYVNVRKDVPNRVSTILGIIPINQEFGKILALPARLTRPEIVINQNVLSNVNIFLTDGDGDPIDFNGQHWSVTIELSIEKIPEKVHVSEAHTSISDVLFKMKRFDVLQRMLKNDVVPPVVTCLLYTSDAADE